MKKIWTLGLLPLVTIAPNFVTLPAQAGDGCTYNLGKSSAGQAIELNLCSIRLIPKTFNVDFTYSLKGEPIKARANCRDRSWITLPERATHKPQSQATSDMLQILCTTPIDGNSDSQIAVVFNPPTNIRNRPNGKVICTITELTAISTGTGGPSGDWYRTSACGGGYVHNSQLRFN
jgi:hypothetical protein